MAKENSVTEVTRQQDNLNVQNVSATAEEIISSFENVQTSDLQQLNAEYMKMEKDKTYDCIFAGMTTMKGDNDSETEAVLLIDKEGRRLINANTIVVSQLKKVTQLPCLVRLVCHGEKRSSNGKNTYTDVDVYVLPKTVSKG